MDTIYLVRHGQSTWNAEGKHQGWAEPPLSELGVRQVAATGQRLAQKDFTAVVSSPTTRALQTAQAIAKLAGFGGEIATDPDLRDARRSASREGGTYTPEEIQTVRGDLDFKFADGENSREFIARTVAAWERLAQSFTGTANILLVTHGMNVKVMLLNALGLLPQVDHNPFLVNHAMRLSNCGLTILNHDPKWEHEGGIYRMTAFNDTGHIELAGLESPLTASATEP